MLFVEVADDMDGLECIAGVLDGSEGVGDEFVGGGFDDPGDIHQRGFVGEGAERHGDGAIDVDRGWGRGGLSAGGEGDKGQERQEEERWVTRHGRS